MKKVLIIEDEPDQVMMMKERLMSAGYEVISSFDGKDGLEKVKSEKPDIILLDILLPKMNGVEVCRELKRDSETRNIPILIITASSREEMRKECMNLGSDGFLFKPYESRELLDKIKKILK